MNNYIIYMHTNKINGKFYIGQTCQTLEKRAGSNGKSYRECERFYKAINEFGWDNFEHTVLLTGLSPEEANAIEEELIINTRSYDPSIGYNIALGGNGMTSERSKALWSNPDYRDRISKANKELWANEEYHTARSNLYREQWKDPEKRKRRSEQAKKRWANKDFYDKARKSVLEACKTSVRCVETGEVFDSIVDACNKYNIHHANLIRSIRKGCRSGGVHWEYV